MPARHFPVSLVSTRRRLSRLAMAVMVATLVATGTVALPAGSDIRADVEDKIQTLIAGRAEVGWQRIADTGHPTQLVGFEWKGAEAGAVEVRAKGPDGWSDWQLVEGAPSEGPDLDSPERHDRTTAGPPCGSVLSKETVLPLPAVTWQISSNWYGGSSG